MKRSRVRPLLALPHQTLPLLCAALFAPAGAGAGELLWHRYLEDPIYLACGISGPEALVFAGNYLNDPREAEAIPLFGLGTPAWVHPGTEFYVDAARHAGVLAAIDCAPADSTITVMEWRSDSATPLWTHRIHPCRPLTNDGWASGKGIQTSDDGSTIAAVVNMYTGTGYRARLVVFDAGVETPVAVYDVPNGTASAMAITPGGEFIAIYAWPAIYVYDRYGLALRWSGAAGSGNDALAISGDGRYLAWGWSTFNLREWDGSTYQPRWATTFPAHYLTECALSADGLSLALAWYPSATFDQTTIEMYALPSLALQWSYDYAAEAEGGGTRSVDVASEMVFSEDGAHLAVSSWGGTHPEIHLFERDQPTPILVHDTPGTMFDIDIVTWAGSAFVAACGKHVHAGQAGRGGDLYAFRIGDASTALEPPGGMTGLSLALAPGRTSLCPGGVGLRFSGEAAGALRLTVHDAAGRLVGELWNGYAAAGPHEVLWRGRERGGAVLAPGVYFARLTDGRASLSRRLVLF